MTPDLREDNLVRRIRIIERAMRIDQDQLNPAIDEGNWISVIAHANGIANLARELELLWHQLQTTRMLKEIAERVDNGVEV